jgi:hypothetical protein
VLKFRDRLLSRAGEGCYMNLFRGQRDPAAFIEQMAHVCCATSSTAAPIRCGCGAPTVLPRAEGIIQRSATLLADLETVEMHASGSQWQPGRA